MSFNDWKEFELHEVIENYNTLRKPLSSKERALKKGIYNYYGAQGVIDYIDEYMLEGEYLLIAEDGANLETRNEDIARLTKKDEKFWVNNHAHIIRNNNKSDLRYICYTLNMIDISGYITGSAQPKLNKNNLNKIKLTLPPIEEQRAIAKILSDIDDKIETNNKINKRLEEMASSIFKHWFVDFEFPNEEGKPYKSSGGEMVESELGMIPKGWEVVKLGDVLEKIIDNRGKTPKTEPSGYRLIEGFSINMGDSFVDKPTEKQKYVNEEIYKTWFRAGHPMHLDILCATVGTLPKWCFANRKENICIAQNIIAIRTNKEICSQYYLKLYMDTREFIGAFNGRVVTTAQPSIKVGHMEGIKILLPDKEIIDRLDSIVKSMYSKIEENSQEINTLINLRDTLLPKLMSGEIRVPYK